jgi:hypothetical protein
MSSFIRMRRTCASTVRSLAIREGVNTRFESACSSQNAHAPRERRGNTRTTPRVPARDSRLQPRHTKRLFAEKGHESPGCFAASPSQGGRCGGGW